MMRWSNTKTYTEDDILRMQQEAVSRVHDFQTRARDPSYYYDTPTYGEFASPSPPPVIEAQSRVIPTQDDPAPQPAAYAPAAPASVTDPISGLLERLNLDGETLLILGLIFLLYNEKADNILLLALGYLLL